MRERGLSRIGTILLILAIVMIVGLIAAWLLQGGATSVGRTVAGLGNPVDIIFHQSTTTYSVQLPWKPDQTTRGPDISQLAAEYDQSVGASQDEGQSLPQQYDNLATQNDVKTFGSPSPYRSLLTLEDGNAESSDPAQEYVRISATGDQSVNLSGFSLQSAVSGLRVYIGTAAASFAIGAINSQSPIYLDPGMSAIVTTGRSPVGTSFRENICTGYLGELQTYQPPLSASCPAPGDRLPANAQNVQRFGQACVDYIGSLPACAMPHQVPSNLSSACVSFIENSFTYGGCALQYAGSPSYYLPTWRIYLGYAAPLWYDTHDTIRLLDAEGRVVDSFSY